jgi:hypothetical protein
VIKIRVVSSSSERRFAAPKAVNFDLNQVGSRRISINALGSNDCDPPRHAKASAALIKGCGSSAVT